MTGGPGQVLRISVIVPCFNAEAYIGEALDSALAQSHSPHEIIVIDDGSTDQSARVISNQFGSRVRYHHQTNKGIGSARNAGVRLADGNCIAFLDADDLWPQDSLGVRIAHLGETPAIHCVYGRTLAFVSPELEPAICAGLYCPSEAQAGRAAGAMLLRKPIFDQIGYFDETLRLGETLDWVARFDEQGFSALAIEDIVLRRRIHMANTTIRERGQQSDYLKLIKASLDRRRAQGPSTPAE